VNLVLYAVTAKEVAAPPLAARFSAAVKDLREAPPSSLAGLLDPGATLTKLQGADVPPEAFRDDLWLRAPAEVPTGRLLPLEPTVWAELVAVVTRLA
jgi:hypothetical protein